ncbi:MAG: hypothetical protein KJT03_13965, partial [Verrucomicrobiae bacterium]|nr:hypothetical protein [Verrucomicrobiae bacterium]
DAYRHTHAQDINDKDEIVGSLNLNNPENFIWLPKPAYGLGSGLHVIFSNNAFSGGPTHINNKGQVLNARMLWDQGETYLLEDLMPENETRKVEFVHDLNNNGIALVRLDDSSHALMTIGAVELKLTADPKKPGYGVDEALDISIRVTHPGSVPVTYEFENGLLIQEPEAEEGADPIIAYEEPELPEPFTLSEGDPLRTFTIPAKTFKPGVARLWTRVKATPANGDPYELEAEVTLLVDPLLVTLRALPLVDEEPIINMKLLEGEEEGEFIVTDEKGNVIEPKVEVTVTNLSDQSIKALLQGVDPRARDKSAVVGRIETLGEFPIELKLNEEDMEGIIGPGESRTQEVDLKIFEDGRFDFAATVTGFFVDNPEATFATVRRGAPIAVGEPYPVELELEFVRTPVITNQNRGAFFVQPGGAIQIIASVNNLTSNSTLEFYGILAKKELNALSAHLTSDLGRAYNPDLPFVHDHVVDANASVILGGTVRTSADGGPSGKVEWQGLKDAKLIDDATLEETELTEEDILVKSTAGGWLGNDLAMRVIQDHSRPEAPPALTGIQEVAIYSYGAMIGMGEWTYDTFDAIGGIGRLAGSISADPSQLADAWGEASRAVWEFAQLLGETWSEMTPEEKEEFILSVVDEVNRRLLLLAATRSPVDAEDTAAVYNWTREATYSLFNGIESAYASDDPAAIANELGRVSGHVAMEVITAAVSELKFTKYVKGAEINKYADNLALGPALNNQEAALRAIRSGPLDDSTVLAAFGPGPEDLRAFERVFGAFKVKGYARERSPISYSLINQRKVAVWKPEIMKPKGISDIDEILLGDNLPLLNGSDGSPINVRGITAIFWPGEDTEILFRLAGKGHSEEVVAAVLARAAKRRKEFSKYMPKFSEWADQGIPVPRNFRDNG